MQLSKVRFYPVYDRRGFLYRFVDDATGLSYIPQIADCGSIKLIPDGRSQLIMYIGKIRRKSLLFDPAIDKIKIKSFFKGGKLYVRIE